MERIDQLFKAVNGAKRELQELEKERIDQLLIAFAQKTIEATESLLVANQKDLQKMKATNPLFDRLLLTETRIKTIAHDIKQVANLKTPVGELIDATKRPNGIRIERRKIPFGTIGVIYEARPNVTFDLFSLCFKTQNCCLLKGSSNAYESNKAIVKLIQEVLTSFGITPNCIALLPPSQEATTTLLQAIGKVDLVIPRGSSRLINFVRENARIPVIETGAGICHTYIDEAANIEMASQIVDNAKTRRVSVCNALDCLIIHEKQLDNLAQIVAPLSSKEVLLFADKRGYEVLKGNYPTQLLLEATEESFGTEFLSYKMAIRVVDSLEEAIEHIASYSSKHSECIVSENSETADAFLKTVDAACVYHNVSTAFTDGAQLGLGAEIGISTQKLHARGPMGLAALCTYKWRIYGEGQIRE